MGEYAADLICGTLSPSFLPAQNENNPRREEAILGFQAAAAIPSGRNSGGTQLWRQQAGRHAAPRTRLARDFAVLDDLFISEAIGSPHRFSPGETNHVDKKSCVTEAVFALFLTFTP